MAAQNSPLKNTSIDLEIEAIKRFRRLVLLISPKCRVRRELNGLDTVLCLDFADCPQELEMKEKEWQECALLLAYSCHHLGLAKAVVFKRGKKIAGWMT